MLETSHWFSTCIVEKNIPTRLQNVKYCEIVAFDTGSCLTLNSKTLGMNRKMSSGIQIEYHFSELSAYARKQSKKQSKLFAFENLPWNSSVKQFFLLVLTATGDTP